MYVRDKDGSENFRLYDVDLTTGIERDLTPVDEVQCRLIAHRKEFPNDVLIGLNKDNPQLHDVYHLDLTTGTLEKIVENPGFLGWVVDTELEGPRRGCATARRRRGDSGARRRGVRMAAAAGGTAGGCGVDGAPWLHERRQGLVLADVGRLEHWPTGEDGHRDGCYRGDRRGSGLRHIRRDDEPRHARRSKPWWCTGIAWSIRSSTTRSAGDIEALQRLHAGELLISDRNDNDTTWLVAFDDDCGPVEVLHVGPRSEGCDVPVRPPAAAQRLPVGADGAFHVSRPGTG